MLSKWGNAHPAGGQITLRFQQNVECSTGWLVTQPTSSSGQRCVLLLEIVVVMPSSCAEMGFTRCHFFFDMPIGWVHHSLIPFADCCVLIVP